MKDSTSTAILLFAQSKKKESTSKKIVHKKKQNILLWEKMYEKTLRTIQKTNLPYFISDETNQFGNTFGEKISYAIQHIFNKGFEKVMVIGNDCLEIQSQHLLEANNKLKSNDFVLGADFNGGAYLIGVSKSVFDTDEFEAVSWKTPFVYEELQTLFSKKTTAFLTNLNDCNSTSDFKKAIHKLSFSNLLRHLILSLLQKRTVPNQYETSLISYEFSTLNFNKGSPFSF